LQKNTMIDHETRSAFDGLMTEEDKLTSIDILGAYPTNSPLAYDSVAVPVAIQWAGSTPTQQEAFWQWRRARPLAASLPMHESERRAMTAGWFLGLVTGQVRLPAEPYNEPVRVWDGASSSWLDFPNPLLTPPARFLANNDWLPAVLESVLLAMARSHESPVMSSMAPYRALRAIYDASPEKPASGILEVSAKAVLTDWLRTGNTGTGWQSQVADTGPDVSIDARAKHAISWLTTVRELTGQHYVAPGRDGATGGGVFSTITLRDQASQTPIFRDIAEDVYWAAGELIDLVEECTLRAERPEYAEPVPTMNAPSAPAQTFRIPDMGQL